MVSNQVLVGDGEALNESVNTIISQFKLLTQEEGGISRSTAMPLTLEPGRGPSYHLNNYNRLVGQNLDFGVDLAQAQQLADARTSYTPGEAGVQVILSGQALRQGADRQLMQRTARIMFNAWDIKEDSDGVAQFPSFTATLGGAGTVMSPGILEAAATILRIGNSLANPEPAEKPWYGQLHPGSATAVRGRVAGYATTPQGGTAYGVADGAHAGVAISNNPGVGRQGAALGAGPGGLGEWAQVILKENANLSVDSSNDTVNAVYSREGFIHVEEVAARMDPDTSDKSMRGAVEMNLWGSYAWGLYRPANKGIAVTADASVPTS
ncbi:MAG TPA: hypothetical protein VGA20_04410 [Gemmatimonadales bacterium]